MVIFLPAVIFHPLHVIFHEVAKRFPRETKQAARLSAVETKLDTKINAVRRRLLAKVSGYMSTLRVGKHSDLQDVLNSLNAHTHEYIYIYIYTLHTFVIIRSTT